MSKDTREDETWRVFFTTTMISEKEIIYFATWLGLSDSDIQLYLKPINEL